MKKNLRNTLAAALVASAMAASAQAGAVLINSGGTVAIGVNDYGHLNYTDGTTFTSNGASGYVGVAIKDGTWKDSTSPGCLCEGWGVSTGSIGGGANINADGVSNLSLVSFTVSGGVATSITKLDGTDLVITQEYKVSAETDSLFVDKVTLSNTGSTALTDVRFVRVMDWDVPPTEFSEYVTIKGTATTTYLELSHDNGFAFANPLVGSSAILGGTTNTDFTDSGTADHGAYFKFNFGTIAAGESFTFNTYYGATFSERTALSALGAVGAELYSLGQSGTPTGASDGTPYTFVFGFRGVGGVPIEPPTSAVPEPSTYGLMGAAALAGIGFLRRRSKKQTS